VTARQILCKILELNQIKEQEKCEIEDNNNNSISPEDSEIGIQLLNQFTYIVYQLWNG
jgi:hypothetical protein